MFKRKLPPFERCRHKRIDLVADSNDPRLITGAELSCPELEDRQFTVSVHAHEVRNDPTYEGSITSWETWTPGQKGSRNKDVYAYDIATAHYHLGKVAGEVACSGCIFADMTPLEVSDERARRVEEALAVARNELRIRQAQISMREAYDEIEQIQQRMDELTPPGADDPEV